MDDKETLFPLNSFGCWHNGAHIINEKLVTQKYLAFVCAIRNSELLLDDNKDLYEMITEAEYDLLSDEEKAVYSNRSDNAYYELKKSLTDSLVKKILKKIKLYTSHEFALFQHSFYNDNNKEKFKFFSLYMHLDQILNEKRSKDIKYYNPNAQKIIFPNTTFATAGISEKDDVICQVEYFMDKKNSHEFFQNNQLFLPGNECYKIDGEVQLFSLNSQNEIIKRSYLKNTVFEITEFPDEEKYPNIAKVKPYLLPCNVYKDNGTLKLQKKIDLKLYIINLLEFNANEKINYLLDNEFISESQFEFIEKFHHLKIESINNNAYQKDIKLRDLICGYDFPELSEFKTCFVNNHALKFDDSEFYVDLSRCPFKEVYFAKKRMLLLTENRNLEAMKHNPCLYEPIPKNKITIDKLIKISCNNVYFKNDNIKYDLTENVYSCYSDNLYYRLDEAKKGVFVSPNDYFTFVSCDDLKIVDEETDIQKKIEKLREIFDEKTNIKNEDFTYGAFEHPSEWNKDDSACKRLGLKQKYIKKKLAIWDNNYYNKSLPDEIKDCRQFTFFYKSQFETFLTDLHQSYASRLIKVQDMVMHKYSYKQGNLGLYEYGFKKNDSQTFCNHAVFETIINVDGNFNNFTKKPANKENISRDPLKEYFPECPDTKKYKYKPSNYWCDVLEEQSENSEETGICKISAEQAFYMAQLGYVVIAAWKNLTPYEGKEGVNYSPHFVTVSPKQDSEIFIDASEINVAHVGGDKNEEKSLFDAFRAKANPIKQKEIYFYCNIYQSFI